LSAASRGDDSLSRRPLHVILVAGAITGLALVPSAGGQAPGSPTELLPNLNQEIPGSIRVERVGAGRRTRFKLRFASQIDNLGTGPLHLVGHRASAAVPAMTVDQVISRSDGSTVTRTNVGTAVYGTRVGQPRWAVLGLTSYELRRASDNRRMRAGSETGFCVEDDSNPNKDVVLPGEPPQPVYGAQGLPACGQDHPELLTIVQGLSVGWGDPFPPQLAGQSLDVTGLPSGRYVLVHRANARLRLAESIAYDNAASVLLRITQSRRKGAAPRVKQVGSGCSESASCLRGS